MIPFLSERARNQCVPYSRRVALRGVLCHQGGQGRQRIRAGCPDPRDASLMLRLVCVFLALAAGLAPVAAETPSPGVSWDASALPQVKPVQITLPPEAIEKFIASLPALLALARDLDREQGRTEAVNLEEDLSFVLVPYLFDPK